jgi:hypothetical protein
MQILKKFQEWFSIKERIDLNTRVPRFEEGQRKVKYGGVILEKM